MNLAINTESYFHTKAIANKRLLELSQKFVSKDAMSIQYGMMIKAYFKHPEQFQIEMSPKIPDGSPIGSSVCKYN